MNRPLLFVDADTNSLEALSRALCGGPRAILTATSRRTAIDRLAVDRVDVVISDYDRPGMGGSALLVRVREAHPGTARFTQTSEPTPEPAAMFRRRPP